MRMNLGYFEVLVASLVFEKFPKETQEILTGIMSTPVETTSVGEVMATKGDAPKVASVEVPAEVHKLPRSPRPSPMPPKEGPKMKKDK